MRATLKNVADERVRLLVRRAVVCHQRLGLGRNVGGDKPKLGVHVLSGDVSEKRPGRQRVLALGENALAGGRTLAGAEWPKVSTPSEACAYLAQPEVVPASYAPEYSSSETSSQPHG